MKILLKGKVKQDDGSIFYYLYDTKSHKTIRIKNRPPGYRPVPQWAYEIWKKIK